ncbi:MAG: hypothetical protein OXI79_14840 [Gammaproteobacteria bacterium]|nr:hypothetical protein [Gammaproteobacteria bacterium]
MPTPAAAETLTAVRVRAAETRSRLLELAAEDDHDDDQAAEFAALTKTAKQLAGREAALLEAGADPEPEPAESDPQAAEFAALVEAADAGDILDACAFGRRVAGATAELLTELECPQNVIPFELLAGPQAAEFAASTVAAAGDESRQMPTIPQVFPTPLGSMFGVERRTVDVGVRTQPVVTAPDEGPAGYTAVGTASADSAVTIGATNLSPSRLQVQCTVGRDELASFRGLAGDVEQLLRQSIASGLDARAVAALLAAGTAPTPTTDVATFASALKLVTDCIDGRHAAGVSDLRLLTGVETARLFERLYRGTGTDLTLADRLRSALAGTMATSLVAAPSSDDQQALVARGARTGAVQAVWGPGVEVMDDPYSLSSEGQRRITACVMTDVEVVRAAVYQRLSLHLA